MGRFCTNCGNELVGAAEVCLVCGKIFTENKQQIITPNHHANTNVNEEGKSLATVSVVFGSLGFIPGIGIIFGIVGLITSIIGVSDATNKYKGRSKIGLGLSIGSLALWILLMIIGDGTIYFY